MGLLDNYKGLQQPATAAAQSPKAGSLLDAYETPSESAPMPSGAVEAPKYESPHQGAEEGVLDRISDPERWKQIIGMPSKAYTSMQDPQGRNLKVEPVAGTPPLAVPGTALPGLAKGVEAVNKLRTGRLGLAGLQGAASGAATGTQKEQETGELDLPGRADNAKSGGLISLLLGTAGEAVSAGSNLLKKPAASAARMTESQANAYTKDPKEIGNLASALKDKSRLPEVQDRAAAEIQSARGQLKSKGLQNASALKELLTGKELEIDPMSLRGTSPEVDAYLDELVSKYQGMYPNPTANIRVGGNEANQLKRLTQQAADFNPATITDPAQKAKHAAAAQKSHNLRTSIEGLDPSGQVGNLNSEMQDSMLLQKNLRQQQRSPIASMKTASYDKLAAQARADKQFGTNLTEFGDKLGAAESFLPRGQDDTLSNEVVKLLGRLGLRGTDAAIKGTEATASNPMARDALLAEILGPRQSNK